MSLQAKLLQSPKYVNHRKISIFNDSLISRTSRNQSYDYDFSARRRPSNPKCRNSNSLLRGSKQGDVSATVTVHYQYAQQAFRENNFNEALRLFQDCINLDPMHLQSRYMIGLCCFSMNQWDKSLRELKLVRENAPKFNKNMFVIMALIYKRLLHFDKAIQILDDGIKHFPDNYEAVIFKGKLEAKMKRFIDSENTLKMAIKMNPMRSIGYSYLGDCQRIQNRMDQAIINYQTAIQLEPQQDTHQQKLNLLKLSVCLYEQGQYSQANVVIDQYLMKEKQSSEANKLKGQILLKTGHATQAQLYFEQAININNSKTAVTKSLIEVAKFHLEQRDFYQMQHTLQRIEYLDVDQQQLQQYIIFAETVLLLMKKKFQEALLMFNKLNHIEVNPPISEIILPYRGYCYMMLQDYQLAMNDFEKSKQYPYNLHICNGVLNFNKFDIAISAFLKAQDYNQVDPNLYISMLLLKQKNEQQNQKALACLEIAGVQATSSLHYLKSLTYCTLNKFDLAFLECQKAIEKADDNNANHYYLRGIIEATSGDLASAVQDFTLCLDLDDQYHRALLQRSKCYCCLQEMQVAFDDMHVYIQNVDDYLSAGNILLINEQYEEAYNTFYQDKVLTDQHYKGIAICLQQLKRFDELNQVLKLIKPIQQNRNQLFTNKSEQLKSQKHSKSSKISHFILPFPDTINMVPEFDMALIDELSPTSIEMRPIAPWIRRNKEGVLFTNDLQQDFTDESEASSRNN